MAHVEDNKGGRAISVELNLVPFIDLMSVLIIFLLITAVWTQVSMIQIGSSVYGKQREDQVSKPPPRVDISFRLDVTHQGYKVVVGKRSLFISKQNANYNQEALIAELKRVKALYPEKMDAVITILDSLPYISLIQGMDGLLTAGFPEISISTEAAAGGV